MQYFNHHITLKLIVSFLDWLARIEVEKYNADGTVRKKIGVPVQFGSRDKFLQIVKNNANLRTDLNPPGIETDPFLPRIGVNLTTMIYDHIRHTKKTNRIKYEEQPGELLSIYNAVPYNLELEATILSKTADDHFQILEQILPFFSPSFSLDIKLLEQFPSESVPIILSTVTPEMPDELDISELRTHTATLVFIMKGNYYMPKYPEKIITSIQDTFINWDTMKRFSRYDITALNPEPTTTQDNRAEEPVDTDITIYEE